MACWCCVAASACSPGACCATAPLVRVAYDEGFSARGRRGLSILEFSLRERRAACACLLGARPLRHLPRARRGRRRARCRRAAEAERDTLARVGAGRDDRLACQARVLGAGVVGDARAAAPMPTPRPRALPEEWARRRDRWRCVVGAGARRPRQGSASTCWARDLAQGPARARATSSPSDAGRADDRRRACAAFTYVVILLLVGIGVEWLYWSYAYAPLRAAQAAPIRSPRQALRPGLRRFFLRPLRLAAVHRRRHRRLGGVLLAARRAGAGRSPPRCFVLVLRFAWVVRRPGARARPAAAAAGAGGERARRLARGDWRWRWSSCLRSGASCPDLIERLGRRGCTPPARCASPPSRLAVRCLLLASRVRFLRPPLARAALSRAPSSSPCWWSLATRSGC